MAIRRRSAPAANTSASSRKLGRNVGAARLIEIEAKGNTAPFADLLSKAADNIESNQISDPFSSHYESAGVASLGPRAALQPMYPFMHLARLVQQSNILRQCIEAYVINIESYGHTLEYIGPEGQLDSPDVQAEKQRLQAFLSACSPESSLREIRENSRWDKETVGWATYEVSRNVKGEIVMFDHIPSITLRRTRKDSEATDVVIEVPNPADPAQMIRKNVARKFCRFVQQSKANGELTYFKEFGDPRPIDPKDGQVNAALPIEEQATEILAMSIYTPGSVYGLPRWIGQIPSVLGSRESEMVNLNFFKENAIPAMAVLISGGALTQESFEVIEQYINAVKGQRAMQRILVLEASADDSSGSTDHALSAPKIDMKPMISERQQEGLFQDYDQKNAGKIRSSFRLPPIYTGRAEDYTRASAYASMLTAENQIFIPERMAFDEIMNNKILRTYKPKYWRFKSMGAPITEPETLSRMLQAFENSGGMTPNTVIKIANKMLGVEIESVTDEWGDIPFEISMAMVQSGTWEIPGLTDFAKRIKDAVQTPASNENAASGKGRKKPKVDPEVAKVIRDEVERIAEDIEQAYIEGRQVPQQEAA